MIFAIIGALVIGSILKKKIKERKDFDATTYGILLGAFTALLWGAVVIAMIEADAKKLVSSTDPAEVTYGKQLKENLSQMTRVFIIVAIIFLIINVVIRLGFAA